jgi:hypothetical protein
MGEAAPDWLSTAGIAARLVATDGDIVRLGGWPAPEPTGPSVTNSTGTARDHGAATNDVAPAQPGRFHS